MVIRVGASLPPKQLSIQKYEPIQRMAVLPTPRFGDASGGKPAGSGFWNSMAKFALFVEMMAVGALGGTLYHVNENAREREREMVTRAVDRLEMNVPEEQWPANTKVYASTIQETSGWGDWFGFLYPRNLVSNLNNPEVKSLDEAHLKMEKGLANPMRFLNGFAQTSVSSPTTAKGWNKSENDSKPRFVLMIMGDALGGEQSMDLETLEERAGYDATFMAEMSNVKTALKDNFDIPEAHIKQLIRPEGLEVLQALKWLQDMEKENPDAEALVYIVAHGMSQPDYRLPVDIQDKQGAYQGNISLNSEDEMTEEDLKALFQKYLSKFKAVNLLMAPCHSGAWISQTSPPAKATPSGVPTGADKQLA